MMHRFDLDVDVHTDEIMAKLAKKNAKAAKKKKKGKAEKKNKKRKAGRKAKDTAKVKKEKGSGTGKRSKKKQEKKQESTQKKKQRKEKEKKKAKKKKKLKKKLKKAGKGKDEGKKKLVKLEAADVAAAFSPVRGERSFPSDQAMVLGYVDLGEDHPRPKEGRAYSLVSASDERVGRIEPPRSTSLCMHLDLNAFYVDGMPGSLSSPNEGFVRVQASTRDPQDPRNGMLDAAFATEFKVEVGSYASGFHRRGVFRNLLLREWIALTVRLYERDPDRPDYDTIKTVFGEVPEIQNLDVLNGVPYLNLATGLFDGVIKTFSRTPDHPFWGELPILEVNPKPGGVFLRTGIYLLGEKFNGKNKPVDLDKLEYRDGRIWRKKGKRLPNHLLIGVSLAEKEPG